MSKRPAFATAMPMLALCLWLLSGCAGSREAYNPSTRIAPEALKQDFDLLRDILERFHPSLYWYTSKDSMDMAFDQARAAIKDSITDTEFGFRILAPAITRIRCGHTSFSFSRAHNKFYDRVRLPSFPLFVKIWGDTMIVTGNMHRKDSLIRRGTQLTAINGMNARQLADSLFLYMPTDGYATNVNYIRLSADLPYYMRNVFGLDDPYDISWIDKNGVEHQSQLPVWKPVRDSLQAEKRPFPTEHHKPTRKERLEDFRSFHIDTARSAAIMTINTFDDGGHLRSFYRESFNTLQQLGIRNLVIDIRTNGGGKVNHYTQLARYLRNTPFKVADTAYALHKSFGKYGRYINNSFWNGLGITFFCSRKADGNLHFRYWENHVFKPRTTDHFDGKVYVLVSGPTFSAATLFCHTVHDQANIKLVGEETGGGHYGNDGLMIPDITLPNSGIRVRLPLFRIVQYNHPVKDGRGVIPDFLVPPSAEGVRRALDRKMQTVLQIIDRENAH
jgi:hypothetical protein